MKKYRALFATLASLAAIATGILVQSAQADTGDVTNSFVCSYVTAGPPMTARADDTSVFADWKSYATGYFAPFAEKAFPTAVQVGDYYLTCALPTGWIISGYVLGDGSAVQTGPDPTPYIQNGLPVPGVFPVITAPPATTTTGS